MTFITTASGLPIGIVFGTLLEKSQLTEADVVRKQFTFDQYRMLQTFLASTATSAISFSLLSLFKKDFKPRVTNTNLVANSVGGLLLGTGLAIAGSCPGTTLVQVGAGKLDSLYIIAGSLFGGLSYSLLHERITKEFQRFDKGNLTLNGKTDFWKVGLPFAGALAGVVYVITKFLSKEKCCEENREEEKQVVEGEETKCCKCCSKLMKKKSWCPILSGVGIGLLQIPANLLACGCLGVSSGYTSVVSNILSWILPSSWLAKQEYLNKCKTHHYTVLNDLGMMIGGCLSASASKVKQENLEKSTQPLSVHEKLSRVLAGFLLLFGSSLAGGCAAGHGISGMGSLSVSSFVTVAAMFAGGMATAQAMKLHCCESKETTLDQ